MATQYGAGGGENVSAIVQTYQTDSQTSDLAAAIEKVLTQNATVSGSAAPPLTSNLSTQQDAGLLDLRGSGSYSGVISSNHDRVIITGDGTTTVGLTNGSNTIKAAGGGDLNVAATGSTGQTVIGGSGSLNAVLGNGPNEVTLGTGNATVSTGSGDDVFQLGSGNATISGGSGHNVAVSSHTRSELTVTTDTDGNLVLTDTTGHSTQLKDVPFVQLSGGASIVKATTADELLVAKLYQGVFDRDPDQNIYFWFDKLKAGATTADIAKAFLTSSEAVSDGYTSTMTSSAFVTKVYQSMLDRAPDPTSELTYWSSALNNLVATGASVTDAQAAVLRSIAQSGEAAVKTEDSVLFAPAPQADITEPLSFSIPADGSQTVAGGSGFDTVAVGGSKADYVVTFDGTTTTIFNTVTGKSSQSSNTEFVTFGDGKVLITPTTFDDAVIARMYDMVFDRDADASGLKFWWESHAAGNSLDSIAQAFLNSPEFNADHPQLSNSAFVDLLYTNMRGTADGDATGHTYWINALDHGASREQIVVDFAKSAESASRLADTVHTTS